MEEIPAENLGSRKRSPLRGAAYILLGTTLSAIMSVVEHPGGLLRQAVRFAPDLGPLGAFFAFVLILTSVIALVISLWRELREPGSPGIRLVAHRLVNRGQRMAAPDALEVMRTDPRPPILYLRSFKADGSRFDPGFEHWTFEQRLERAFRRLGPFVAIGNPLEEHPHLGAARLYVQDEDWRKTIAQLIQKAQLVVLEAGGSAGLLWEVHQTTKAIDPRRMLLALPRFECNGAMVDHETYRQFRDAAASAFPVPLPDVPDNAMFLAFDHAWRPRFLVPGEHDGRASDLLAQNRAWDELRNEFRAQPADPESSPHRPTDTTAPVAESHQCPHCKSPNPAGAVRCNCGWVFQGGFLGPSARARAADVPVPKDWTRSPVSYAPVAVLALGFIVLRLVSDGMHPVASFLGLLVLVALFVRLAKRAWA